MGYWIFTQCRHQSGGWTIEYSLCVCQGQADTPLNIMLMITRCWPESGRYAIEYYVADADGSAEHRLYINPVSATGRRMGYWYLLPVHCSQPDWLLSEALMMWMGWPDAQCVVNGQADELFIIILILQTGQADTGCRFILCPPGWCGWSC